MNVFLFCKAIERRDGSDGSAMAWPKARMISMTKKQFALYGAVQHVMKKFHSQFPERYIQMVPVCILTHALYRSDVKFFPGKEEGPSAQEVQDMQLLDSNWQRQRCHSDVMFNQLWHKYWKRWTSQRNDM